jgi:prepilin-type N-terminal cleavage/methylation domain-containing protein/prepilin-type processing-associated H-X9-DG protein
MKRYQNRANWTVVRDGNKPGELASPGRSAFTLIELLVVIAIIGILAAMLLPVLSRAKARGLSVACLNNVRQLEACWHLYALDHNDVLPPNNSIANVGGGIPTVAAASWCTNYAPWDAAPDGIQNGLLFAYNTSLGIYHCPADQSTIETHAGVKLPQPRLRSYNMSLAINGEPEADPFAPYDPSFKKFTEIRNPSPSGLFVFLDVHEDEILDANFGMPALSVWGDVKVWWDVPANRHSQGCNLSFGDGHAEHWKWRVPKVVKNRWGGPQAVPPEELPDYRRVQEGYHQ